MPEDLEPETDWEAESDANVLAQAEEIRLDFQRSMKARGAAKKMVEKRTKEAEAMANIAGKQQPIVVGKRRGGILGALPISPYYD